MNALHPFQGTCLLYIKLCKLSNLLAEISATLVRVRTAVDSSLPIILRYTLRDKLRVIVREIS